MYRFKTGQRFSFDMKLRITSALWESILFIVKVKSSRILELRIVEVYFCRLWDFE